MIEVIRWVNGIIYVISNLSVSFWHINAITSGCVTQSSKRAVITNCLFPLSWFAITMSWEPMSSLSPTPLSCLAGLSGGVSEHTVLVCWFCRLAGTNDTSVVSVSVPMHGWREDRPVWEWHRHSSREQLVSRCTCVSSNSSLTITAGLRWYCSVSSDWSQVSQWLMRDRSSGGSWWPEWDWSQVRDRFCVVDWSVSIDLLLFAQVKVDMSPPHAVTHSLCCVISVSASMELFTRSRHSWWLERSCRHRHTDHETCTVKFLQVCTIHIRMCWKLNCGIWMWNVRMTIPFVAQFQWSDMQPVWHAASLTCSQTYVQPVSQAASLTCSQSHMQPVSQTASITGSQYHRQPVSHAASLTCSQYHRQLV